MGWLQFAAMKKTFRQLSLIAGFILTTQNLNAQQNNSSGNTDSSNIKNLPDITVVGRHSNSDYQQMPEIVGTNIYAGKKGAVVVMDHVQGNVPYPISLRVLKCAAAVSVVLLSRFLLKCVPTVKFLYLSNGWYVTAAKETDVAWPIN